MEFKKGDNIDSTWFDQFEIIWNKLCPGIPSRLLFWQFFLSRPLFYEGLSTNKSTGQTFLQSWTSRVCVLIHPRKLTARTSKNHYTNWKGKSFQPWSNPPWLWVQNVNFPGCTPTSCKSSSNSTCRGYNRSYAFTRSFIRVITPFISSRGPPCTHPVFFRSCFFVYMLLLK